MSDLMVFNFDNNQITAVIYDGKPAFVAVEVAKTLGYNDEHQALNKHCKSLIRLDSVETTSLGFGFRPKGIILIREADVYRLVMRSKLPSAERFQDWVCEDVLPALRENGHYGFKPALPDFTDPVAAARAWADEVEQKLLVKKENERLTLENKVLAPKAAVCDAIVKNDMHRTASEVAKPLGMSAVKLNRKLSAVGVYDLRCRRRVFSQWFIDEGYGEMRVTHDGYEQAVFTAKGQVWITELLTCN
ncbi:BRO family protein [Escherichia coli]|uniref:BRO family protein n=1 Tax=Escherichia coli TaxID=562 RepID=UPI00201A9163|nr:BRO family protein [Escherichia coli]